eukprot:879098_1
MDLFEHRMPIMARNWDPSQMTSGLVPHHTNSVATSNPSRARMELLLERMASMPRNWHSLQMNPGIVGPNINSVATSNARMDLLLERMASMQPVATSEPNRARMDLLLRQIASSVHAGNCDPSHINDVDLSANHLVNTAGQTSDANSKRMTSTFERIAALLNTPNTSNIDNKSAQNTMNLQPGTEQTNEDTSANVLRDVDVNREGILHLKKVFDLWSKENTSNIHIKKETHTNDAMETDSDDDIESTESTHVTATTFGDKQMILHGALTHQTCDKMKLERLTSFTKDQIDEAFKFWSIKDILNRHGDGYRIPNALQSAKLAETARKNSIISDLIKSCGPIMCQSRSQGKLQMSTLQVNKRDRPNSKTTDEPPSKKQKIDEIGKLKQQLEDYRAEVARLRKEKEASKPAINVGATPPIILPATPTTMTNSSSALSATTNSSSPSTNSNNPTTHSRKATSTKTNKKSGLSLPALNPKSKKK